MSSRHRLHVVSNHKHHSGQPELEQKPVIHSMSETMTPLLANAVLNKRNWKTKHMSRRFHRVWKCFTSAARADRDYPSGGESISLCQTTHVRQVHPLRQHQRSHTSQKPFGSNSLPDLFHPAAHFWCPHMEEEHSDDCSERKHSTGASSSAFVAGDSKTPLILGQGVEDASSNCAS